jgi:hypothetical protein
MFPKDPVIKISINNLLIKLLEKIDICHYNFFIYNITFLVDIFQLAQDEFTKILIEKPQNMGLKIIQTSLDYYFSEI